MAFARAANYNNLPNGVFSPLHYSMKTQLAFRKKSVVMGITNSDYIGEIKNYGDSVRIMKEPEVQVSSYVRGQQVTPQDLEDSDFSLVIDRANKFAFKLDDIEVHQSHVNFMDLASDRASYRLMEAYDSEVLAYLTGYEVNAAGVYVARTTPNGDKSEASADGDELLSRNKLGRSEFVSAGAATDSIVIGTSGTFDATPVQLLNRISRRMDELNVDQDGRWVVIDPVFKEALMDENSKFMNHDFQTTENLSNGQIAANKIRGFRIYESNNLPIFGTGPGTVDLDGSNTNYGVLIAGHDSSVAVATSISKTEKIRDPDSFADIIRGLQLYGRKILRPQALVRAIYNVNK